MRYRKFAANPDKPCPKCGKPLAIEDTRPGEVTAYCSNCGFRLVVTNTELAADMARKDPLLALRMLVDGQQWDNICKALGGKSIVIPGKAEHRHKKQNKKGISRYSKDIEDKVIELKRDGMQLNNIAKKVEIPLTAVTHIIYILRRDDLNFSRKPYSIGKGREDRK